MYRLALSESKTNTYTELRLSIAKHLADIEAGGDVRSYMKAMPDSRLKEWQKAEALGWPEGQYLLALYFIDDNTPYSTELLRKAALQGFAPAQYGMGIRFYYGTGVTDNALEAERWLRKAEAQGHKKARERLRGWEGRTLYEFMNEVDDFLERRSR